MWCGQVCVNRTVYGVGKHVLIGPLCLVWASM